MWTVKISMGFALMLLLVCALTGCGGGNTSPPPPPPPTSAIKITPASANVAAGGSLLFAASIRGNANPAINWEVNGTAGGNATVGTISASGQYVAPVAANQVVISAILQSDQSMSGKANVMVLAPHGIAVRPTGTLAEFYDSASGNSFVPRGNNYIRLANQTQPDGSTTFYHSTFNVGLYSATAVEAALASMQASGYNTIRVWLNGCCPNGIGNSAGGLSSAYLANVADFLHRAKNHGIFAIFTTDWVPFLGGYTNNYGGCTQFSGYNTLNLCAGGVQANISFFHDLAQSLVNRGADLDAIFAYELRNEYYYEADQPPLNSTSGMVTAADGQTYDMSSPASQQQMMDDGLTYFTDQVRAAILAVDPTALVTVGFFPSHVPNPFLVGDPRVISIYPAMANSRLILWTCIRIPLFGV